MDEGETERIEPCKSSTYEHEFEHRVITFVLFESVSNVPTVLAEQDQLTL